MTQYDSYMLLEIMIPNLLITLKFINTIKEGLKVFYLQITKNLKIQKKMIYNIMTSELKMYKKKLFFNKTVG
jgi:hypothetical protein